MRIFLLLLVPCLMSIIIGLNSLGCGTTPEGPPHPHAGKVEYSRLQLKLDDIRVHKTGGLLVVALDWNNLKGNGTPYRYRIFWHDARGGVLSSADQGWRNVTMNHGYYTMKLVAKNAEAEDFRLTIVKDK